MPQLQTGILSTAGWNFGGLSYPVVLPGTSFDSTFVSGTQNDYALPYGTTTLGFTGTATDVRRLTGISALGINDGQLLVVQNFDTGSGTGLAPHYVEVLFSNGGSLAANQIIAPGRTVGDSYFLPPNGSMTLKYTSSVGWLVIDVGGGKLPQTRQERIQQQTAAIDPTARREWWTQFTGVEDVFQTLSGGGAIVRSLNSAILLTTGATAGAFCNVQQGDAAAAGFNVTNPRTGIWAAYARAQFPTSTANSRFQFCGLMDSGGTHFSGLTLVGTGVGTATLNMTFDGVNVATSWTFDTTSFHEFMFWWWGSGGVNTAFALVDGLRVGSSNANQPHTQQSRFFAQAFNNGVASSEAWNLQEAAVYSQT